nr:heparan-alpha-glucosaminide N-acetyltransferase domain-containing protein [Verrucomicrobiae bacterium]
RGFDMFWIIGADSLVEAMKTMSENPFTSFIAGQLTHKEWEGFAFEDLIFPLFVFMAGVSLVFSLEKMVAQEGRAAAVGRVIRRGVLLWVIGVFYYDWFKDVTPGLRFMGVLQRIALSSMFAGLIFCYFKKRGIAVICAGLLILYWALMVFVPVPGLGAGHFEKGANLANYVDEHFLPGYKWEGKWDPEGLLSTIPAIASCLLGVLAGFLMKNNAVAPMRKVGILLGAGAAGVALGFLWGLEFPVIKKIWTSSYVLVAGGFSAMLLAAFYLVIDVWHKQEWCVPFVWIGLNPLTIYLFEKLVNYEKVSSRFLGGDIKAFFNAQVTQGFGNFLVACGGLVIAFAFARFLHTRRLYLRL